MTESEILGILANTGLKITKMRRRILTLLANNTADHLSVEDIAEKLYAMYTEKPSIATIYRVLAGFVVHKIVLRHSMISGTAIYEYNHNLNHEHFYCLDCGHISEFHSTEAQEIIQSIAMQNSKKVVQQSHIIYTHCLNEACAKRPL